MKKQLKATITLSLAGIVSAACAPQSDSYLMTPNTPPPKVYGYTAAAAKSDKTPVTHSHSGKVHTHILPPSGIIHTHVAPVRTSTATTNTAVVRPIYRPNPQVQYRPAPAPRYAPVPTPAPRYMPAPAPRYVPAPAPRYAPAPTPAPRYVPTPAPRYVPAPAPRYTPAPQPNYSYSPAPQPTTDTYTGSAYDYSGVGDYNTSATTSPSTNYNSTLPATTSNDSYYSYGTNSSGDYYNYTKPKAQPANPNYAYDYSTGSASSGGYSDYSVNSLKNPSVSTSTSNYAGGNSYTVQRGDTVFQVMRNTGVYWKDIIRLNQLKGPAYNINPGQVLVLK